MAGNTKLLGFSPRPDGEGGVINLERWGDKVTVLISEESLARIRNACSSLPTSPPPQEKENGFKAKYDEGVGKVRVAMDPETARAIALLFEDCINFDAPLNHSVIRSWIHSLKTEVRAHEDYHNRHGEPGVKDTP